MPSTSGYISHHERRQRDRSCTLMGTMATPTLQYAQRSFLFCLLLLLSICSATNSFQQSTAWRQHSIVRPQEYPFSQTISKASSIDLPSLIGVYGGTSSPPTSTALVADTQERRRKRIKRKARSLHDDSEYQQRKQEWARKYTTLEGLRETFGVNQNKLYGDLDVPTTRKLYKSLLPTAVCELVLEVEVKPEELAQLAYEARKAAKLYARERCHVPARLLANCYDGIRSFKRYGRFQVEGMSYDQIFDKYYQRSALERALLQTNRTEVALADGDRSWWKRNKDRGYDDDDDDAIVTQTCMKILESACRTNPLIDRMTLPSSENHRKQERRRKRHETLTEELEKISQTLEDDVRKLLDPYSTHS